MDREKIGRGSGGDRGEIGGGSGRDREALKLPRLKQWQKSWSHADIGMRVFEKKIKVNQYIFSIYLCVIMSKSNPVR